MDVCPTCGETMTMFHPVHPADVEYGIMLDCDKQGCVPRHGDHGIITHRSPSKAQVEQYKIDGKWLINNHAATLVYRTFSPWEPVALNNGKA